nr:low molecular weight phosphotyrosine protein phosphatase [Propionibacterium sp.]
MSGVVFVCWGNICRSPMGERVAREHFAAAGLGHVPVTSAGVSAEEAGNPIDRRAQRTLRENGYSYEGHRAHRITAAEIAAADLVLAFEPLHVDRLRRLAPTASNIALMTDFIPGADTDSIADPWYGGQEGFTETLAAVEAAMPGIVARVRELLG